MRLLLRCGLFAAFLTVTTLVGGCSPTADAPPVVPSKTEGTALPVTPADSSTDSPEKAKAAEGS